jgi:DHA2 family multidrug resistance protein-like MFS transporter
MLTPVIVRRVRPGVVVSAALVLAAAGFAILTQAGGGSLATVSVGLVVMSLGVSPVFTLATDLIVGNAPPERAGAAASISETGAEFGGALGIAVLGSIGAAVYRGRLSDVDAIGLPPEAAATARDTLGGAVAVSQQLPEPLGAALLSAAGDAFVRGLELTAAISAVIAAGMAVLAAILLRHVGANAAPAGEGEPEHSAPHPPLNAQPEFQSGG